VPQSITIAAFVFGAVLLLIAILHGSFKIFGAEVSGTAGGFGRLFAGLLGVILICVGLFGSFDKAGDKSGNQPVANPQTTSTTNPQPAEPANRQPAHDTSKSPSGGSAPVENNIVPAQQPAHQRESVVAQPADAEPPVNVTGIWRDALGTVYQVSQQGSTYSFQASGANFGSVGRGTIRGHQLESTYETQYINGVRSTGRCTGVLSPDTRTLESSCIDSMYGPSQSVVAR
jgi:hypothetical protein